jgi:hypothetical protein
MFKRALAKWTSSVWILYPEVRIFETLGRHVQMSFSGWAIRLEIEVMISGSVRKIETVCRPSSERTKVLTSKSRGETRATAEMRPKRLMESESA